MRQEDRKVCINKSKITVIMSMEEYEHYEHADWLSDHFTGILERANQNGTAVMTDELRKAIEEIYA